MSKLTQLQIVTNTDWHLYIKYETGLKTYPYGNENGMNYFIKLCIYNLTVGASYVGSVKKPTLNEIECTSFLTWGINNSL